MNGIVADRVIVELEAKLQKYDADVAQADAKFGKAMANIEKSASKAEKAVTKSFAGLAAKAGLLASTAIAAVGGALVSLAVSAVKSMAELQKTAEGLGISAQALQQYDYAAKTANISQEDMRAGLQSLNEMLGKAALGAEAPNKIFKALGVTLKDASGNVKSAAEVFPQLADRLNAIPDPAQRAATAALIFGDNASALKPLLDEGASGIENLREAAERLGIVLSDKQLQEADKLAQKMNDLWTVLTTSIQSVVVSNADSILGLANSFVQLAAAIPDAIDAYKRWRLENSIALYSGINTATFGLSGGQELQTFKRELANMNLKGPLAWLEAQNAGRDVMGNLISRPPAGVPPNVSNLLAPKPARGRKGPDLAAQAERREKAYNDQMARLEDELLGLMQDITNDAQERARLEVQRIDNASQAYADEVDSRVALKQLNQADGDRLKAAEQRNAAEKRNLVNERLQEQMLRDDLEIRSSSLRNEQDILSSQADLADTRAERRDLELRLLDLAYQMEREEQEAVLASSQATEAQKQIARQRLAILGQLQGADAESVRRQYESPLDRYRRDLNNPDRANDEVENAVIDELQSVRDSISSAVQKTLGVKNPILAALINSFIEQQLIKPFLDGLGGVTGGGILGGGFLGGIFGFASGGSMTLGGRGGTDRNMLSLNGRPIANVSRGETLNIGSKALGGGGGDAGYTIVQHITVDARNSVNPEGFAQQILSISGQQAERAKQEAIRQTPILMAKRQRYG